MTDTKIKICGITNVEDAHLVLSLGVDYLGLIFADSPRRVDVPRAKEIREAVPDAMIIGVFIDAPLDAVVQTASECGLNLIQLHGQESPEYCDELRTATGLPIIKAFKVSDMPDTQALGRYETTSYFLFDLDKKAIESDELPEMTTKLWKHTSKRRREGFRIFIAGALDASTVREAVRKTRAYGVDVCRGVERSPGLKDHEALKEFIAEVQR